MKVRVSSVHQSELTSLVTVEANTEDETYMSCTIAVGVTRQNSLDAEVADAKKIVAQLAQALADFAERP